MFERPRRGERAILVYVGLNGPVQDDEKSEFHELARSAGAEVADTLACTKSAPEPRYFLGRGKAEELRQSVHDNEAELVLFDHSLSPGQERNLERLLGCRVLDRSGLILDIFAQRARSHEGKLQVELAQLAHLSTRLVRGWTHLERQKGGIGLRGPGETQLETDRRLIGNRIKQLRKRLARVESRREQGRRTRAKAQIPTVSLVGYTNAGKSTLFNRLTDSYTYSADQLFATLDPTLRRLELNGSDPVVLADTVGFVRDLPHDLVAAFKATLTETREAALLLHVIDASDRGRSEHAEQVDVVLDQIGAGDLRQIRVYNKLDLIDAAPRMERGADGKVTQVWMSAETGEGADLLLEALAEEFEPDTVEGVLTLGAASARLRAELFALGAVRTEEPQDDGGTVLTLKLRKKDYARLVRDGYAEMTDAFDEAPGAEDAGLLRSPARAARV